MLAPASGELVWLCEHYATAPGMHVVSLEPPIEFQSVPVRWAMFCKACWAQAPGVSLFPGTPAYEAQAAKLTVCARMP